MESLLSKIQHRQETVVHLGLPACMQGWMARKVLDPPPPPNTETLWCLVWELGSMPASLPFALRVLRSQPGPEQHD